MERLHLQPQAPLDSSCRSKTQYIFALRRIPRRCSRLQALNTMKTIALVIMLLMGAQPAVFASASACAPSSCSMSCCKGKVCCCKHHDKDISSHGSAKANKGVPMPGCSLGCSNPAENFIAPSDKNLLSMLDFTLYPVTTELFVRSQEVSGGVLHATSPPLVSFVAFPLPLRI